MCHKLDPRFFQELGGMDPGEVCRRTLCRFDRERRIYLVEAWGHDYEVSPGSADIRPQDHGAPPINTEFGLAILFYLLRAQDEPLSGEWVSEKDLPGGVTFFRGPHAVPVGLIHDRFGRDLEGFRARCESMGGTSMDLADAAFAFRLLPRAPAAVLLWAADDEFEARARLLFDRTVSVHLPLDVIFGLSVEVCSRLSRDR